METEFRGVPERYDPITNEQGRVDQFTRTVRGLDQLMVATVEIDFAAEQPVYMAASQFMNTHDTSYGLYLPPELKKDREGVEDFYPRISRGGKRSGHGVFFGDLKFTDGQTLPVAVKPHWDEPVHSCLKDYLNNLAVLRIGVETLRPAGFLFSSDTKTAYSMTLLEDGLTTLDSVDWSSFYPDILKNQGMINIWKLMAENLAYIHAIGSINHGDIAARNIAQTPEGNLFFIDWERARISLATPRDAEVRYSYSHPDLLTLIESMCYPTHDNFKAGIGVFYQKEGDWWQGFSELVFDHYKADRIAYAEQGSHHEQNLRDVKEELAVLEQELKSDMVMFHDICQTR